jgi:hypothetical protein
MILTRARAQRSGAYLALAALALSFAHIHNHDLGLSRLDYANVVSVKRARSGEQAAEQLPTRLADDDEHCPICFSSFLLSNSSIPDKPANPSSLEFRFVDRSVNPGSYGVFQSRRAAFLSRAPPAA